MITKLYSRIRWEHVRILLVLLPFLVGAVWSLRMAMAAFDPNQGPGGPILVVTSSTSNFGKYYAEILRNEGVNAFAVADVSTVTAATLAPYDVVILAKMPLSSAQVTAFTTWVNGGGNLIAMAPDPQLASLLGLTPTGSTLSDRYLLVDTSTSAGNGIVNQTMQFHGTANLYTLNGATSIATLYSNATVATPNPAITLNSVGLLNGGKAAAFAYDLATSVVYTRQGNPAWAAQERDGFTPIRSDDKFFGASAGDPQPDWIDLSKLAIPQADEQQRLLVQLITSMNLNKKPLPRFWYFPNGKKAVVIMTGDDHGNGGTVGRFDQFKASSPAGCSVANWECVRGTSYVYPSTPALTNAQAAAYTADGFEVGLHVNTSCADFTPASLETLYVQQIADWTTAYASIPPPITQRHHCIVWSDWVTGAKVQLNHGIRLDTSYYFWPPGWVNNTPGLFTGSAMPMRFADLDGNLVDVYNAVTQMTDESGQTYPFTPDALLSRAVGPEGYYGAYTVNAHTDIALSSVADAVVASALARGVPIVSSRQMLDWLDARNNSSFGALAWNGNSLSFTIAPASGANGLQAMVPMRSANGGVLSTITRSASAVTFVVESIKGIQYAFFAASVGTYVATYVSDITSPTVTATSPVNGATGVGVAIAVTATFSEAMDPATITTSSFELRDVANALIPATVIYNAATLTATLTPSSALAGSTTYAATVKGGAADPRVKDLAGNALAANAAWSFTTGAGPSCPCSGWSSSTIPTNPSVSDPGPVELGVKFRTDVSGLITGIRFYKGTGNTGTHIGNLWTSAGQLLATATFTSETASGWQQVNFATPVAIAANTVYVASYFAPNGKYAGDNSFFANTGVDNGVVHLLKDGVNGGNGVYAYSATSTFPTSTFQATNYWVDLVFATGAADTTPPTVSATSPANGAVGVSPATTVTATFSEAMDPATINTNTFELRNSANVLVPANVTYSAATLAATLTPSSPLAALTTYTATVRGGATDPRAKDAAGNALAANVTWSFTTAADPCTSSPNPIVAENCRTGNPASEWDISGAGDPSIQGFATQISVNRGDTAFFKVNTNATNYRFDIYRMGYYAGSGARKTDTVLPSATLPQTQPSCVTVAATGLIDCGNWAVSGSWAVPANAVSGIYFAKVVRVDTGGASHIVFVVRDDASTSDLLFQTSDTTWQAYNNYGGNSLYTGSPVGRAYKVSYNRPFNTRAVDGGQDWLFNTEYPMVRWLEANGYNVSYFTGVDSDRSGALLRNHKVFLSVGHDEYWSGGQRANVEAARNANPGVHLAFFSGNEVFWKTRWETSIDGSGTPYRTLVCYKETHANAKIDPDPAWTGTWRDPRFSPPADGGRPENALTGTLFMVNDGATTSITVPAADGKMRFWRNTSIANLAAGTSATLPNGTLGYEWDVDADNGFRPAGLIRMSTTTVPGAPVLLDYGSTYGSGTATHSLTQYKHSSGALVFGGGTVQWPWGLDAVHDRAGTPTDVRMRQATVNLLADMGAQPATLQSGLVPASASTDTAAPTSAITTPVNGASVQQGSTVTITGTATDAGGGVVGGVEVSVDGGTTWRPANGRATWTFNWTPTALGTVTIKARSADDSGNLEVPGPGIAVTVSAQTCPCSVWNNSTLPTVVSAPDTGAVELGVKFRTDVSGFITGIRFYKGSANTGTHIGNLWSGTGTRLATATFTNETTSGWQQVNFATPVAITANTVYVASYLAPNGGYAADSSYFANSGIDSGVLHFLQNGVSGGNGVFTYSATSTFPTSTFQATNYWVDLVFATGAADTTPPTVSATSPANGAAGVSPATTVTATFSEAMDSATINTNTFELRNSANVLVPVNVTYSAATLAATLTPSSPLAASTTYTATVRGGATDPRAKDAAGNALAANVTWSFTTSSADVTPPSVPTGLTATATTSGVVVSWTANTEADLAGYHMYRSASASGPFTRLNAVLLTSPSYEDTLAPNGTSFYAVTAVDASGNQSAQSVAASAAMTTANLLLNPGFELDANNDTRPDNWTANTLVTRSNALARSGTYAMRHFDTTNAGYTITQVVSGLTAATTYTFAGWTNIPSTGDTFTFTIRIRWRNASNTILRTDNVKVYNTSTSGWDKATASLVAPAGTTNAQVQMVVSSLNATIYVDDFALR